MRKSLTSLRAIVVFFVFVTHLRFLYQGADFFDFHETYLGNGDVCVSFFFILSGLVFTLGYGERFAHLSLRECGSFIWKRLKKTYPLYITTIAIMIAWNAYLAPDALAYVQEQTRNIILALTLTQTFFPTLGASMIFNGAAWYLSCTFALYLLTPLLLRLNQMVRQRTWASRFILVLAIAGYAAWQAYLVYGGFSDLMRSQLGYFHPVCRVFQFVAGIMLANLVLQAERGEGAIALKDDSLLASGLELAALLVWIGTFIFMPLIARELVPQGAPLGFEYLVSYPVHFIVSVFLVWTFAHDAGAVSRLFHGRAIVELGTLSFEFFLIHWVIIHVLGSRLIGAELDAFTVILIVFLFFASLAFSVLWHWFGVFLRPQHPHQAFQASEDQLNLSSDSESEQVFVRIEN